MTFIVPFIITILVLYIILKILSLPIKIIFKLIINAVVGGAIIFVINLIGAAFGFTLMLTWWTAVIVGVLGIPGVILVAIIQFLL